jgi:dihydroceramidase
MQLLDEIPMIWAICVMCYTNYELIESIENIEASCKTPKSSLKKNIVFAILAGLSIVITYLYMFQLTNPIFHEMCYASIYITVIFQSAFIVRRLRLSPRLYLLSVGYIAIGFFLWNADNHFCAYLTRYRSFIDTYMFDTSRNTSVGANVFNFVLILLQAVSQLHSWWHLFAGFSAYLGIINTMNVLESTHLLANPQNTKPSKARPIRSDYFNLIYNLNPDCLKQKETV